MAEIVLGVGSSHGPTMNTPPERWSELGEKDQADGRYDYASLPHRPGIEREVTIDKFRERYDALQRNVAQLWGVIQDARPDVIVVLSNPHGGVTTDLMQPTFGIHLNDAPTFADERAKTRPSRWREDQAETRTARDEAAQAARPRGDNRQFPTDGDLARHLMNGLIEEGIDVAASFQSRPGAGLDSAYNLLYQRFDTEATIPYVPVLLSRYLPNQATPRRCYEFGQTLRRVIERWDSDKRVAIMASGGLSHQILDEELDRVVIDALVEGNTDVLTSLDRAQLNRAPGTPEILNWVATAGAMEPRTCPATVRSPAPGTA
jgi:hypothetical protein